eukprot:scaffold14174_cov46-Cyclotella_meneghiniana.AAC.2
MTSAAEAELGALFMNAKTATPMRKTLEEFGHTNGVINNEFSQKQQRPWSCAFTGYKGSWELRTVSISLPPGQRQFGGLLDKTSPSNPPPNDAPNNIV